MRNRLTLAAGLTVCALLAGAPALAGDPATPAPTPDRPPRVLDPRHSSGEQPGRVVAPLPFAGRARTTVRVSWRVAPGVTYTRWSRTDGRGPMRAHLLTIDPSTRGLAIDYANSGAVRRVAPLTDILARDRAIAGVNGDFYDIGGTGAPLGLGKDRELGLLHARQAGWNKAFYLDQNGRAAIGELPMTARVRGHADLTVTNLNSPFVTPGGIGVYTPRWGRTAGYRVTQGQRQQVREVVVHRGRVVKNRGRLSLNRRIPGTVLIGRGPSAVQLRRQLPVGTPVKVGYSLTGRPQMAISGNNFLVHQGIIRAIDDRTLHPRTAVGVDQDTGEVLLLVVDGRSSRSRGATMVELADLMVDLGADEAINLDGGGSSTMVARNRQGRVAVLNRPSEGSLRRVANAISIRYRAP